MSAFVEKTFSAIRHRNAGWWVAVGEAVFFGLMTFLIVSAMKRQPIFFAADSTCYWEADRLTTFRDANAFHERALQDFVTELFTRQAAESDEASRRYGFYALPAMERDFRRDIYDAVVEEARQHWAEFEALKRRQYPTIERWFKAQSTDTEMDAVVTVHLDYIDQVGGVTRTTDERVRVLFRITLNPHMSENGRPPLVVVGYKVTPLKEGQSS
jgi:hypothetical protein